MIMFHVNLQGCRQFFKVHIKMHDEKLQASTLGCEASKTNDEHMGSEKTPGCLGFIGDYTTQL